MQPRTLYSILASNTDMGDLLAEMNPTYMGKRCRDLFLRLRCLLRGHHMRHDRWVNKDNPLEGEWHIGCARCPKFTTRPFSPRLPPPPGFRRL